jgi:hypothetical protein
MELAPFLQSVTGSWMEIDWVGNIGGKRGSLKESIPKSGPAVMKVTSSLFLFILTTLAHI